MVRSYRQHMMAFWAFALLVITMGWGASAYAFTPAGTVIKSLATVTYLDGAGNSYTAQSNESSVTVAEVYSAQLLRSQEKDGAVGQTVYFPHQLVNNGNAPDSFTLSFTDADKFNKLAIYLDKNGNGQQDQGEQEVKAPVEVAAGQSVDLVVAAQIKTNEGGSTITFNLTATATEGLFADEDDKSTDTGKTTFNTDTINIVSGPVLVATKTLVKHDKAKIGEDGSVTYRISVKNNGSDLDANGAGIYDFFPSFMILNDADDVTSTTNDSRLGTLVVDKDENLKAKLPNDLPYIAENDYDNGIYLPINRLEAGASLEWEFTVTYSAGTGAEDDYKFGANQSLQNKAFVGFVRTNDSEAWTKAVSTNTVTDYLPQFFGVEAHDRSGNDESHDHTTPDTPDIDTVASAPMGGIASFQVIVKNTGNGADSYNLSVANAATNGFPAGTTFSFTNNLDVVTIARRESAIIGVDALLPPGVSSKDAAGYNATFTATSVGGEGKSDTVTLHLDKILGEGVDLAYDNTNTNSTDEDKYDATKPESPTSLAPGATTTFDLYVHNESGVAKSFVLNAYDGVEANGSQNSYKGTNLVDDLQITFRAEGATQVINHTPLIDAGKSLKVIVEVTAPVSQQPDAYHFAVIASTSDNSINDAIGYWVKVEENGSLSLTPNGSQQIEAGGVITYNHRLENLSTNKTHTAVVTTAQTGVTTDWAYIVTPISPDPADAGVVVGDNPTPEGFTVTLAPGKSIDIQVKVLAPAVVLPGDTNVLTLTATYDTDTDTSRTTEATDTTVVIQGQIVLKKTVAHADAPEVFATNLPDVKPGDTIIWKVVATVKGSAAANNVIITDTAPPFTTFTKVGANNIGDPTISGTSPNGNAVVAGNNITFYVGEGSNGNENKGGTLQAGEIVEVTFKVTLDK